MTSLTVPLGRPPPWLSWKFESDIELHLYFWALHIFLFLTNFVIFFERGYWKEIIVDDKIPVDHGKYQCPLFMKPFEKNIGPLIIEKAYAKCTKSYYNFDKQYPRGYDLSR